MEDKGYIIKQLTDEEMGSFYSEWINNPSNFFPELFNNCYLVLQDTQGKNIEIFKFQNNELKNVYPSLINSTYMGKIKPQTMEQTMAVDLLSDESVPVKIIRGVYGAGKDMLMFSKALELIEKGVYQKIVYIRPNVTVKDVPDIGYLRGDVDEKLSWTFGPLCDKVGGKENIDNLIFHNRLELMPLLFIRGRSFEDSIVYVTEGQNITTEIAKLLLGRIGNHSLLIINADTHQTDNKVYDKDNGIIKMIEKLKGNSLFGYIYLSETLRSDTANLANLLD